MIFSDLLCPYDKSLDYICMKSKIAFEKIAVADKFIRHSRR